MAQKQVAMSTLRNIAAVLTVAALITTTRAGPVPNNATTTDIGLKSANCALGDVVYMPGDVFPGSSPCERCACAAGQVTCTKQTCAPRPGCKAVHRPDHCCPTYQCDCEQEGRVYGNGEKLVDPADPCRVCYCQGGEVVCRRIACFKRDDCKPRLVPGRCCPEYDNCPLRGVTSAPGAAATSSLPIEEIISVVPSTTPEKTKPEITIKEITPVSEIPVITEVKIKEILPSPNIEIVEYTSSKAPLIPREATTEKPKSSGSDESSDIYDKTSSISPIFSLLPIQELNTKSSLSSSETKISAESSPSKFSFSTQDSINSEIYSSNVPVTKSTSTSPQYTPSTTRASIIEEEDSTLLDHNPAFPPLPDDFSVLRNHEEEIMPEIVLDSEHASSVAEKTNAPTELTTTITTEPTTKFTEQSTTVAKKDLTTQNPIIQNDKTTQSPIIIKDETTKNPIINIISTAATIQEPSASTLSKKTENTSQGTQLTETITAKSSPMLNLRAAIPTELLNEPASESDVINGELDDDEEDLIIPTKENDNGVVTEVATVSTKTKEGSVVTEKKIDTPSQEPTTILTTKSPSTKKTEPLSTKTLDSTITYMHPTELSSESTNLHEQTTSAIVKSNLATEVTSPTELSSIPIETSDQNPLSTTKNIETYKISLPNVVDSQTTDTPIKGLTEAKTITIPKFTNQKSDGDNIETTEFVVNSFGSSETSTDNIELIKTSDKSAAIIDATSGRNKNFMTDLIKLVGDVASISDHTDGPDPVKQATTTFSDSEELIPVNAGYKSKNNNWNLNSITEVPSKGRNPSTNKAKIVEIEDDEASGITDLPAPNDKMEPTTQRPIIDSVSDDQSGNKTSQNDIEIITKSYVPTINRRPTKVIMKKNSDKAISEATPTDVLPVSLAEVATEDSVAPTGYSAIPFEGIERATSEPSQDTSAVTQ